MRRGSDSRTEKPKIWKKVKFQDPKKVKKSKISEWFPMDLGRFVGVRNDIKKVFQGPNRDYWINRDLPSKGCVSPRGESEGGQQPPPVKGGLSARL